MRRSIWPWLCVLFLLGCSPAHRQDIRAKNFQELKRLETGMSKAEVMEIMGTGTETVRENIYYRGWLVGYHHIEVSNPFKSEVTVVEDRTFEIVYYYTDMFGMHLGYWIPEPGDGVATDKVLTPLVFEEGRLIGWGWDFAVEMNIVEEEYEVSPYPLEWFG